MLAATVITTIGVSPLRDYIKSFRMPHLEPSMEHPEYYESGDVVLDSTGSAFFFIKFDEENMTLCNLLSVDDGVLYRNCAAAGLKVAKKYQILEVRQVIDKDSNLPFLVVQTYDNRCLLFSNTIMQHFVSNCTNMHASISNFVGSLHSLRKFKAPQGDIDFSVSPDNVAWIDDLESIGKMSDLFALQPASEELTRARLRFIANILVPYLKGNNLLPVSAARTLFDSATNLLSDARRIHSIHLNSDEVLTVVGDIDGSYSDLIKLFHANHLPLPKNKYLFNGNFIGTSGKSSAACLFVLLAYKIALPDHFFINIGCNESHSIGMANLEEELHVYYSSYDLFGESRAAIFRNLPLAHVLNDSILIIHGALPGDFDINAYNSKSELGTLNMECLNEPVHLCSDLLGSDAANNSKKFDLKEIEKVLDRHSLQGLIRSHPFDLPGEESRHAGRCISVLTSPKYAGPRYVLRITSELGLMHTYFAFIDRDWDLKCIKCKMDPPLQSPAELKSCLSRAKQVRPEHKRVKFAFDDDEEEGGGKDER